jgi:hypothetical protein
MITKNIKEYNTRYYNLHKEEILKKRNKGIRNTKKIEVGDRFGRLTILNFLGSDEKSNLCFLCKCECGKEKSVARSYLLNGRVKSCGCLKLDTTRKTGKNTIQYAIKANLTGIEELSGEILSHIKYNAEIRNIKYDVSKEYLWDLFLKQNKICALSGVSIVLGNRYKRLTTTASLDRMNSSLGYVEGNVQWVHKLINMMKRRLTNDEFLDWCKTIITYNENKSIRVVK